MSQQDDKRGGIGGLFDRLTLTWRLMADRRVNLPNKIIPLLAVLYLISPVDIIPEVLLLPGGPLAAIGLLDDVGIIMLAMNFFINLAPSDVVREHLEDLQRRYTGAAQRKSKTDDNVVEGEYRYRD